MNRIYNGQAAQDYFVLKCLKNKKNGTFLEIGSHDAKNISNTYLLETNHNWHGIMVEIDSNFLPDYKLYRAKSIPIINDATLIDYNLAFKENNMPLNCDYLQIDLEVDNRSTLSVLECINNQLFNEYKFAVVTFEHDIYRGDYYNTRLKSREIFESRGYIRIFSDVGGDINMPFEDWYVHPDLVDMNYIKNFLKQNTPTISYLTILDIIDSV